MSLTFQKIPGTDIEIHLCSSWGSREAGYREKIRAGIAEYALQTGFGTAEELSKLSNLQQLPVLPRGRVSVSHCPTVGGFAVSRTARRLGFDIELIDRPLTSHLNRVSTTDEVAQAPNVALLWTAKEAAYKALSDIDPEFYLRDIEVADWRIFAMRHNFVASPQGHELKVYGTSWIGEGVALAVVSDALHSPENLPEILPEHLPEPLPGQLFGEISGEISRQR